MSFKLKTLVFNRRFFAVKVWETPSVSAKAAYTPCMAAFSLNIDRLAVPSACQGNSCENE
jgi:hypothetical protein